MSKRFVPILFIVFGLVLIGGAFYTWTRLGQPEDLSSAYLASQAQGVYPDIDRVTLEGAKVAYDQGIAVFVDVRGDVFFDESHIPGALSISSAEIATRYTELKPDDWIIPYCS